MMWALAVKTSLGNVYHLVRDGDRAACDRRLRVEHRQYTEPKDDGGICAKCYGRFVWLAGEKTNGVPMIKEGNRYVEKKS